MGTPWRPQPVKLICGLLSGDVDLLGRARQMLARRFGPIDLESPLWPFTQSDYYADELGDSVQRAFVSFDAPVDPQRLPEVKLETNALEKRMAEECLSSGRVVNLDPGYLDLSKLVLATTKDRSHRVYLSQGIFGEVTLHYARDAWQVWPWTYPDYRSSDCHAFFSLVRARLLEQRRASEARA